MTVPGDLPARAPSRFWLGVAVGWLAQLGLKTLLPVLVLVACRIWLLGAGADSPDGVPPGGSPLWYALQASIVFGSAVAGALAAVLARRRPLGLAVALVFLSLLATVFEQFPRPLSGGVALVWTLGPCAGLVVGVWIGWRRVRRRDGA